MRRGFTIIELSFVLAVMAIILAITVPTYKRVVDGARADEARIYLQAIVHAEFQYFRDHGSYLACEAKGEIPKAPVPFPKDQECWTRLGVSPDSAVRYRYSVAQEGTSFVAIAEGDLDGDGTTSRFALHGGDLRLETSNELE